MRAKVLLMFAGALLTAGLVFTLTGCNGEPAPQVIRTPTDADVVDAIENQRHCPVMTGMEIDRSIYVDHEGKRVYFCCAGCIGAFEEEPEKYMEKLHEIHDDPEAMDHDHDHDHGHH